MSGGSGMLFLLARHAIRGAAGAKEAAACARSAGAAGGRWLCTDATPEPSSTEPSTEPSSNGDAVWATLQNVPRAAIRSDIMSFLNATGANVPSENVFLEYDKSYRGMQWIVKFGSPSDRMLAAKHCQDGPTIGPREVKILPIDEEDVNTRLDFSRTVLGENPSLFVVVDKLPPATEMSHVEDMFKKFDTLGDLELLESQVPRHKVGKAGFKPFKLAVVRMASTEEGLRAVREKQGTPINLSPGGGGGQGGGRDRIRVRSLQ